MSTSLRYSSRYLFHVEFDYYDTNIDDTVHINEQVSRVTLSSKDTITITYGPNDYRKYNAYYINCISNFSLEIVKGHNKSAIRAACMPKLEH